MRRTAIDLVTPLLFVLLLLAGCDSGDPTDGPDPRDVAGRYDFTEFRFQPVAGAVQPIVLLDTLAASETDLRLSSDGTYILSFQFVNGSPFFLNGTFTVSTTAVEIAGRDDQSATYTRLLLTSTFVLRRDANDSDVLTAQMPKTIDPSQFSNRYKGLHSLEGTLHIRLERRR